MNKELLKDKLGRPLTQSLFLELGYSDYAVFTLNDEDKEYKGEVYPSLKRLYLEAGDPTEYAFAVKHLINWKHWERLCANKVILKHIEEWRFELEVKLRSEGVRSLIMSAQEGKVQASTWLANRGWDKRAAGRPSKEELEREGKVQEKLSNEYDDDVAYLFDREG